MSPAKDNYHQRISRNISTELIIFLKKDRTKYFMHLLA
ncbi:hypothetical protein MCERE19_02524 [Spirosomataceae bacterium]